MQEQKSLISNKVNKIVSEINNCIDCLYFTENLNIRHMILGQLKCKIQEMQYISIMLCNENLQMPIEMLHNLLAQRKPALELPQNSSSQRIFTLEQLAMYNGLNGKPAYVAVNGIVYDVTNNAAWAAASHFGLSAGKNLTNELERCHAGQPVLNNLTNVGKLV